MQLTILDTDNWREIWATLMRNKTRTLLTGFGIFWGVAMLAMLTGGARGAEDMLRRNFAGFVTNSAGFNPQQTTMPYKGLQKGRQWYMDTTDITMIRRHVPGIDAVTGIYQKWDGSSLRHGRHTASGTMIGADQDYTKILIPNIIDGRFINAADDRAERKVAVLGKNLASALFPGQEAVGRSVEVDGISYAVVGVAASMSDMTMGGRIDDSVIVPAATFRRANGWDDVVGFVMASGKPGVDMSDLADNVSALVRRRHRVHPADTSAMWVMNVAHEFKMVDTMFRGITFVAWFIGFSTLLAGIIGIGNIMWVIVKERTQEIGIRRAIGAHPRDIIAQVLCEGLALTLLAGLCGIVFATLALGITHHLCNQPGPDGLAPMEAHFQMSLTGALGILCLFTLLGILAGLIPSLRTMKIKPVEAINTK